MSLKDLFDERKNLKSLEPISKDDFKEEVESFDYVKAINKRDARFVAIENFHDPSAFARFGSAEKYYEDSIQRIYNTYPYDGSLKEKIYWEISSSLLDLYLFENGYPRTTGYANFITPSTATGADVGAGNVTFMPPSGDDEYILVKGGPHAGSGDSLYYDYITDDVVYRKDANIHNLDDERENNLLIDGTRGNTVEFWLKKEAYDAASKPENIEFIVDTHVTGTTYTSADYGRFMVGLCTTGTIGNNDDKPIILSYASGSNRMELYLGASTLTSASIADGNWHHYAIRVKTSGSNTVADLFVDGEHNDKAIDTTKTIDYVSGAIVATVGAQAAPFFAGVQERGQRGWSKFSGSLDELRYWKTWRTSKQIQRYWFDQVGGGTNTDLSNTDLGVYFKFNEGITQTSSVDSTVLDYSGRVSNGTWTGYGTNSRSTGSAINECNFTSFSGSEFKDPIIYSHHNDVVDYKAQMKNSGTIHDDVNANSLMSYIPSWIVEENETQNDIKNKNYLWNLLQVMSAYFDEATLLIDKIPELSQQKYYSGVANPPPFNKKGLESSGFLVPEIFLDESLLEKFEDRDEKIKFESTLQEVKNTIYQNLYNNLNVIYKSKGTEKSFRNLIRCFGFGDETLKFNIYGNNVTHKLEDNLKFVSKPFNFIDFNQVNNSDASVYQYKIDTNSTSKISKVPTSVDTDGLAFTAEVNVILPNRVGIDEYAQVKERYSKGQVSNLYPLTVESNIFGMHSAVAAENDLTWATNDYANFQIHTVKDDLFSSNSYFKLEGTAGSVFPTLTSSLFNNNYDNQLWTLSVTVEPKKYPLVEQVSGSDDDASGYTVRFYGVNHIADYKYQSFVVTGSMTKTQGENFFNSDKRMFVGAHRTNFTGSLLRSADTQVGSCKAWINSLPTGTIDKHNIKLENYGSDSPTQNAFLYQNFVKDFNIPEIETLSLRWDFNLVSGSNSNGQFSVEDESSGSATDNRFREFSSMVSRRHTASGSFFKESSTSVVSSIERSTQIPQMIEILNDSDLTRILSEDDEYFNRNTRPTTYHLSIEKNLFQSISEDMLNMFGSAVWFNNMVGNPVNAYRMEYKELKKAADLYFQNIDNDYDFDKYVEYFKFIDYAMSRYVSKLIPASMLTFEDGISTVIENFVLGDRSKYNNKFPTIKDVRPDDIKGQLLGVNETLYNWKFGHAPVSDAENDNCLWWKERAERTDLALTSGDADIDTNKQQQLDSIVNETDADSATFADYNPATDKIKSTYEGSTYATRRLAKPYKIRGVNQPDIHGGGNAYQNKKIEFFDSIRKRPTPEGANDGGLITIEPLPAGESGGSSLDDFPGCEDPLELANLKGKRKWSFSAQTCIDDTAFTVDDKFKGDLVFPFGLYSSSVENNPATGNLYEFQPNLDITNLHHDSYGPYNDVPMQGPFTEKYVGGRPYRHVFTNLNPVNESLDRKGDRIEGWELSVSTTAIDLKNPETPRAVYFRDGIAKRPVNVANIQQLTGAAPTDDQYIHPSDTTIIGNYSKGYEIVMTNGRTINNRFLVEASGAISTASTDSYYLSGVVDFTLPRRDLTGSNSYVIVNRFSSPGDPATMAEGMLDVEAGEYSIYNALPWRNLMVRQPLNELYRDHSKQFGYFSDSYYSSSWDLAIDSGYKAVASYPGTSGSVNELNYDGSASFHKINRNTRKILRYEDEFTGPAGTVITSSTRDNAFITHQIPRSDMQYAWITGNTDNEIIGYEDKNYALADYASTDIIFPSRSEYVSVFVKDTGWEFGVDYENYIANSKASPGTDEMLAGKFIPTLFNHVVTNVKQPVSAAGTSLGYDSAISTLEYLNESLIDEGLIESHGGKYNANAATASLLNAILLNRQGPYGGANWKLYRKDNHSLVNYQRNHNKITIQDFKAFYAPTGMTQIKGYTPKTITEPPVTSKYHPLVYMLPPSGREEYVRTLMSLGNIDSHFTDHTKELPSWGFIPTVGISGDEYTSKHLDVFLKVPKNNTFSQYQAFLAYLNEKEDMSKVQLAYTETIYPKGLYTYLSGTRKRLEFINPFWHNNREKRNEISYINSMDELVRKASKWKLDAHFDYVGDNANIPYKGGTSASPTYENIGELQNCYSLFHYQTASNILPAVNYNRRIKLIHPKRTEILSRTGATPFYNNRENIPAAPIGLPLIPGLNSSPTPARFSASVGDTLWEATSSRDFKPFGYDSYDDYAEEGFRVLKEGTIIPEYKISDHIDAFVSKGVNLEYDNYNPMDFFDVLDVTEFENKLKISDGMLNITGSSVQTLAAKADVANFLERYTFSDFYKYFKMIEHDYKDKRPEDKLQEQEQLNTTKHRLVCDAVLKFLPYDGFYPSERCTQLGGIFKASLTSSLEGANSNLRTALQPFFAPGVLFNSIKSGIAVDYPIFSSSVGHEATSSLIWGSNTAISATIFSNRLNMDHLLRPNLAYGDPIKIVDGELDYDTRINSTASIFEVDSRHTFAMSNFLAASQGFFLRANKQTNDSNIELSNGAYIESLPFEQISMGGTKKNEIQIGVGQGGTYSMDIVLRNSTNIIDESTFRTQKKALQGNFPDSTNYRGFPHITSSLQVNSSSITMYSRATMGYDIDPFLYGSSFGPPVHAGDMAENLLNDWTRVSGSDVHGTSFDPYTPSYYNGYSKVNISVTLEEGIEYPLETVLQQLTYSYDRMNTFLYPTTPAAAGTITSELAAGYAEQTSAYLNAMQLSASIYDGNGRKTQGALAGYRDILYKSPIIPVYSNDRDGEVIGTKQMKKIIFRPRWECPVLDFSNVTPTYSYVSGTVAKGMWHQYGSIPGVGKGIILQTLEPNPKHNEDKSLAKLLRINTKKKSKIGQLKLKETLSEAIIAVPFKYNNQTDESYTYDMNPSYYNLVRNLLYYNPQDKWLYSNTTKIRTWEEMRHKLDGTSEDMLNELKSIYDLFLVCRKYVMPPHLDLLHNPNIGKNFINPFVFYAMEFEIDLDQDDLLNIWQNVEPTFARKMVRKKTYTNAHLMPTDQRTAQAVDLDRADPGSVKSHAFHYFDMFNPENTRWAVFKAKKRARNNLNAVIGKDCDGFCRDDLWLGGNPSPQLNDFLYSYNWPHDFFSLVELAKVDSITTFNPNYNDNIKTVNKTEGD